MPRPPRTPISLAWERILFGSPPYRDACGREVPLPPEAHEEWSALCAEHFTEEGLARISADDANLLGTLGWTLAMERGDPAAALERVLRCSQHPTWSDLDEISRHFVLSYTARARWALGDRAAALRDFRDLLALLRPDYRLPLSVVRNDLIQITCEEYADEIADRAFCERARLVVGRFDGSFDVAARLRPGRSTWQEVFDALEATIPVRDDDTHC